MPTITKAQTKDFWKYMKKRYKFRVIDKDDNVGMELVGSALEMMRIQDKDDFLENYTTTIGNRIYIPFEIGEGNAKQRAQQVMTCVHECQHLIQWRRDPEYSLKYLLSDAGRTHYEVDAYTTNMEMYWWFYGKLLDPGKLAGMLKGYGVGKADIRVAKKRLTIARKVVERGGIVSGASKTAIKWLDQHVVGNKMIEVKLINV